MRLPERIGSYRIVQQVGRGAAGRTFIAVSDASTQATTHVVCIKTPHPRFANDPAYLADLENEARLASQLEHPHIVALREHGLDADGTHYLVYRYIEGLDLGELIEGVKSKRQQLDWSLVATIAAQMARALDYAHADTRQSGRLSPRPPVIHRDVCPANILIGVSGVAYLTDFGIAKAAESASLMPSLSGSGRIAYSAPERLMHGRHYDARADLFSLGVVLFEALTNTLPYDGRTMAAYIHQVFGGQRPNIESLRAEYHPSTPPPSGGLRQLAAIVDRLLEPDPGARFASAAEVVDALGQIQIPPSAYRELIHAAEDHMPAWRRNVRVRTGERREQRPAIPKSLWGRTDPQQITDLLSDEPLDSDRDAIRLSPEGAERLLAQRHVPLATTLPGYTADPATLNFGVTDRDRPRFDVEAGVLVGEDDLGAAVLTPPPFVDAPAIPETRDSRPAFKPEALAAEGEPWIPETRDSRPAFKAALAGAGASEVQPPDEQPHPSPAAGTTSRTTPAHARVATSLPAYEVSAAGMLAPVGAAVKPSPAQPRRRARWIPWAVAAIALALLVLPCVVIAGFAITRAAVSRTGVPESAANRRDHPQTRE